MSNVLGSPLTPIAVVGMACRLPGGIDSPQKLWEALLNGEDFVTEIPKDRWDGDEMYDPESGVPGRSVSKWGAFLDLDDVTGFDPDFFGINEREAIAMDPQHRLLMETSWEAVEHAGMTPASMAGTATGVFIGMSHDDYAMVTDNAGVFDQAYAFTGNPFSMASGRISHSLGLTGPSFSLDTACSSSMVAIHQACRSLHEGESEMALAGGVMLMLDPRLYASASGQGMLSPTGKCHSFDIEADGFVRAEACGIVMLKRLDDAQRDGDRIMAVIRATASNQDGRTRNILTPSKDAQVAVFQSALKFAGVDPATVGMVEGHGTGTPVGDGIEYASVSAVYGKETRCALTSVKSNFGHAESAAGVLGLMKGVLKPVVVDWLGLPINIVDVLILSLARHEAAAGLLLSMVVGGMLDYIQVIVAVAITTMFVPCFANIVAMCKQIGVAKGLLMALIINVSSFALAGILHWILVFFSAGSTG